MSRLSKADVAGVLLGMDFVKAESIIRKRLDVGTVVEGQSAGSFNPFNQFRGFHGKNGSESIVLFRASAQNNKVIAAVYAKRQNERFDPKLVARRLKKKYGDNLHIDRTNMGLWSASMDPNSCNVRIGQTRSARYLKTITRFGTSQPYTPTLSVPGYKKGRLPSESTWEKCGPTVKYELRSTELRIVLFNLAEYGAQVLRTSKAAGVK